MEKVFIISLFIISLSCSGQSYLGGSTDNGAVITWEDDIIDVGQIKKDSPVTVVYKFKNEGLKPLIIQNVETSCGCTVPEYPRIPIKPMSSGEIKATYDAKKIGIFSKSIKVTTNASEKPKELILKGEVVPE